MSRAAERLARWPLFEGVPAEAIEALLRAGQVRRFQAGDRAYVEGQPSDGGALLVVSGRFRATMEHGGVSRPLSEIGPAEILGEVGLALPELQRSSTVTALEPSTCLALDHALLDELSDNPAMIALERQMLAGLAQRIAGTTEAIRGVWAEVDAQDAPKGLLDRLAGIFGRRA